MIDNEMAAIEIGTGLSAVCAWCEHWYKSKDRGKTTMCGKGCGGPLSGKGFPLYKGPMNGMLHTFCFICGKEAQAAVEISGRMIGVCKRVGPGDEKCIDKMRSILSGRAVVVNEMVVSAL